MTAATTIRVGGTEGSDGPDGYDVVIGHAVADRAVGLLGEAVERVLVVHPPTLAVWAQRLAEAVRESGRRAYPAVVPDAEEAKSAAVAADLWRALGEAGFTRTDAVLGVGGGTVTDLAGFVAATWLRGVQVVQVPTTLLGMVDAAVGGKTGINTAEGKNLVGAFHPPAGVLCDLDALATLPAPDLAAGMAEVVKCGFIADPRILELVEADPVDALDVEGPFLRQLVERAIQVKADVVTADLRESSLREVLNYGHTFGHAIEQVEGYRWRHGEAVSVGMVFVAELARLTGKLAPHVVDRHREVLTSLGLPVTYAPDRWDALLTAMRRDKKARGSQLRFVVLEDVARPVRLEGPPDEVVRAAYDAITIGA